MKTIRDKNDEKYKERETNVQRKMREHKQEITNTQHTQSNKKTTIIEYIYIYICVYKTKIAIKKQTNK